MLFMSIYSYTEYPKTMEIFMLIGESWVNFKHFSSAKIIVKLTSLLTSY